MTLLRRFIVAIREPIDRIWQGDVADGNPESP